MQSSSPFPHVIDLDEDGDDDQSKLLSTPPEVGNNSETNTTRLSTGLPVTKAGITGSSLGIARVAISTTGTSTVMVGHQVSMVGPGIVRISIGMTKASTGALGTQAETTETSVVWAGTTSGLTGSSDSVSQLANQFQQMTITSHFVCPVTFLLNAIQPDYLERVDLANECLLDYLGMIDASLLKVKDYLFCVSLYVSKCQSDLHFIHFLTPVHDS